MVQTVKKPGNGVIGTDPWERLPNETKTQYDHFLTYLRLGPSRTLSKAGQELKKSKNYLAVLSAENGWVKRAEAWDQENDRIFEHEKRERIKRTAKEHVDIGNAILSKTAEALIYHDIKRGEVPKRIPLGDVPKWADVGIKIVRMGLGMDEDPGRYKPSDATEDITQVVLEVLEQYPDAKKALLLRLMTEDEREQAGEGG